MAKVYLLIGGNMGDRFLNLSEARGAITHQAGTVLNCSSLYETAAWGITEQPSFLNQALLIETSLEAEKLLQVLLQIENTLGRKRIQKFGPRIIDIDILFYNNDCINTESLKVPHPEIQNRRFALAPICEIAPQFVHPVLQKTMEQLLAECPDLLPVNMLQDEA